MAQSASEKTVGIRVREMDHIVLKVRYVERAIEFYTEVLGLTPHRVDEYRAGKAHFPCARVNDEQASASL